MGGFFGGAFVHVAVDQSGESVICSQPIRVLNRHVGHNPTASTAIGRVSYGTMSVSHRPSAREREAGIGGPVSTCGTKRLAMSTTAICLLLFHRSLTVLMQLITRQISRKRRSKEPRRSICECCVDRVTLRHPSILTPYNYFVAWYCLESLFCPFVR